MKAERVRVSWEILGHFEEEGEGYLRRIVTGDETWVHHYDPENKRRSMEHPHKGSPVPKKFKTKASAAQVMLTVFWNSESIVIADFLEDGATVNPEHYIETLKSLKKRIMRKGQKLMMSYFKTMPGLTQVPP
jgi:hypothetical protein